MSSIPTQVNYKTIAPSVNNKYRYVRIPMNNLTGSGFTITPSTSQSVEYKLPSAVYNLAQSMIGYQIVLPAQGASTSAWLHDDTLDLITNVTFSSAQNADLVNLNAA